MRPVIPLLLMFTLSAAAQPEQKGSALAVVEKAVKAHGGVDQIKKLRVAQVNYTARGNMPFLPIAGDVDISVEETYQMPRQIKKVIKGKAGGMDISLTWAINGDKWWYRDKDGKTVVVDKKLDVEGQFRPYQILEQLANHQQFQWSLVPDKDGKKPAVRARSDKTKSDAVFRFDQTRGLLVGVMRKQVLPKETDEIDLEVRLSGYKEVGGLNLPMRQTTHHGGKKVFEIEVSQVRFFQKLDDRIFAAP